MDYEKKIKNKEDEEGKSNKRWKKSLIVAGVFITIGIVGSIISGIYVIPKL